MSDIFISHASEDEKIARKVRRSEERVPLVFGLLEHSFVEGRPAQLTVDEIRASTRSHGSGPPGHGSSR